MSLALAPPTRLDLALRDNDDGLVALAWKAADQITPIVIGLAVVTLQFDLPAVEYDDDGLPLPPPDAVRVLVDSLTPGDPAGWIDATEYVNGRVLAHLPYGLWTDIETRTGRWDCVAVSDVATVTRCLARGEFVIEEGVS